MHFFLKWVNLSFQHKTNLPSFGQWPSLQTTGLSPPTDSSETNGSLLTCFNQYLWKLGTEKQWKSESYAATEPLKCCIVPAEWNYWALIIFIAPHSSRAAGAAGTQSGKDDRETSRRLTNMVKTMQSFPNFSRFRLSLNLARIIWDGSICPTAQVVLNISQFSQRTVELLRTTWSEWLCTSSFDARPSNCGFSWWKKEQQLLLVKGKSKCDPTALFWG